MKAIEPGDRVEVQWVGGTFRRGYVMSELPWERSNGVYRVCLDGEKDPHRVPRSYVRKLTLLELLAEAAHDPVP